MLSLRAPSSARCESSRTIHCLWIELGQVRQAEGNFVQAENLARKGLSLATGDPRTQSSAWRLIAEALRARGRAPEASEAEARANELATR